MDNSKDISEKKNKQVKLVLNSSEIKQLADFFEVLMQIDKRTNITGTYGNKQDK